MITVKPFALSPNMGSGMEAILRRSQGGARHRLQVADLSYDLDTFLRR